jgi:hypothetical protein
MSKQSKSRQAPKKQLLAVQTSRHLRVASRRHTGHVLPRRTTSYPTLAMIVLCVGVFLISWTRTVTANQGSYTVNASVPGPPPSVPATIDAPDDGSQFTSAPITLSGTCPLNTYVGLTRNSFSSGVALCDASGNYQLTTDLFKGTNQLIVYDYSFTDAQGPASNMVTVYYTPPTPPNPPPNSGGTTGSASGSGKTSKASKSTLYNPLSPAAANLPEPLLLKSNFTFMGYYVGQPAAWQLEVEGGTAPYAVDAEWGDGHQQLYSQPQAGTISLQHVYAKTGGYHGSYVVKITATDAAGNQTFLQLMAIVSPKPKTLPATGGTTTGNGVNLLGGINFGHVVGLAWSGYGVVLLMLISFWLGERRELRYVYLHAKRPRHA